MRRSRSCGHVAGSSPDRHAAPIDFADAQRGRDAGSKASRPADGAGRSRCPNDAKGALMSWTIRNAFTAGLAGLGFLAGLGLAGPARAVDPEVAELLKILHERGSLT